MEAQQRNPGESFDDEKARYLKSLSSDEVDRSRAGRPDPQIITFLQTVNATADYFTTSSCAGRLILVQTLPGKGYSVDWLFVSHELVPNADSILEALASRQQVTGAELWYKMEPPILAICARTVGHAQRFMDVARTAGIKRVSITGTRDKIMLVVMDTQRMETMLAKDGRLMVSNEYIREITAVANEKLSKSREKFERLRLTLESQLR